MEDKVAALEEEISILKGEIKSILQEVRTAVLAAENPFSGGAVSHPASAPPTASQPGPAAEPRVIPVVAPASPGAAEQERAEARPLDVAPLPPAREEAESPAPMPASAEAVPGAASRTPPPPRLVLERAPGAPQRLRVLKAPEQASESDYGSEEELPSRQLDVGSMATLMVWVEETRQRLDDRHLRIVLALGRYGGLIAPDLEQVLLEVSGLVEPRSESTRVSVNDCLVALRQLEAVMATGGAGGLALVTADRRPLRRGRGRREVRTSRRQ